MNLYTRFSKQLGSEVSEGDCTYDNLIMIISYGDMWSLIFRIPLFYYSMGKTPKRNFSRQILAKLEGCEDIISLQRFGQGTKVFIVILSRTRYTLFGEKGTTEDTELSLQQRRSLLNW